MGNAEEEFLKVLKKYNEVAAKEKCTSSDGRMTVLMEIARSKNWADAVKAVVDMGCDVNANLRIGESRIC